MLDHGGNSVSQVSQLLLFSIPSPGLAPWTHQVPVFRRLEMENMRREDDGEDVIIF